LTDQSSIASIPVEDVRFVKELYPRLKPHDDVVEHVRPVPLPPPFGTPEYLGLLDWRHGRTPAEGNPPA
jgi:hypothetical protein